MANVLPVQQQQAILALHAQGRSIRRIARELGIHRNTVRDHLQGVAPDPKCTTLPTPGSPPKCTLSTPGKMGRKSLCDPHADWIRSRVEGGLSAQRIFQDLQIELRFTGSYQAVKRFVHRLKAAQPERVWRIEVQPDRKSVV